MIFVIAPRYVDGRDYTPIDKWHILCYNIKHHPEWMRSFERM